MANRKSKIQNLKWLATAVLAAIFATGAGSSAAQQPGKIPRISFLIATSRSAITTRLDAFGAGLRERGYLEGKNILIDYRSAEGAENRMPELAAELIGLKVDVIFSTGPRSTRAAKKATSTIPIIMGFDNDPVGNGFVASLPARAVTSQGSRLSRLRSAESSWKS